MKELSKSDIEELALVFVLANTPASLVRGMNRCSAMTKLRQWSADELVRYYDRITARAKRSEFVVSLAYAVLCALMLRVRDGVRVNVDASRLLWGEYIAQIVTRSGVPTGRFDVSIPLAKPTVLVSSSVSSNTPLILGPDGRPLR